MYGIKFRQKAATNNSLKWPTIDSQLWLKNFTAAPSLLKEDIEVFQSGPSSSSTSRGTENHTCHNFHRGAPCARTTCNYAHKCNRSGCGKDRPRIKEQKKNLPKSGKVTLAPKHLPPRKSSFGGVVTPINVESLYQALSNHPDKEFVNKLCSELR